MFKTLVDADISHAKDPAKSIDLPKIIEPADRKQILEKITNRTYKPEVVKRYYTLIPRIRAIITSMDPVTGIYKAPNEFKVDKRMKVVSDKQNKQLAALLYQSTESVDYTSMWQGSANVGIGEHKNIYEVRHHNGLDMIYVWISQHVMIESGSSRTDVLAALDNLPDMYKGPKPIAENEQKIQNSLMAGVTPNWLTHGLPALRIVKNKGSAWKNECDENNYQKSSWATPPASYDVARFLLDVINLVKKVDDEEHITEQCVSMKKHGKSTAFNTQVKSDDDDSEDWKPNAKLTKVLNKHTHKDIDKVTKDEKQQVVNAMLAEAPKMNMKTKWKNGKIVAEAVLLRGGQELTLSKINKAEKVMKSNKREREEDSKSDSKGNKKQKSNSGFTCR